MSTDAPASSDAPPAVRPAPATPSRLLVLTAAVVAALLAWAGGEWVEKANEVPIVNEFTVSGGDQLARRAASLITRATLAYGLLGATLGLALGAAGGLSGRSPARALAAGGLGLVLGLLAGAGASRVLVPVFLRNENTQAEDLLLPLIVLGGTWSLIGAAAGLALGVGLGGTLATPIRAAFGGLAGGAVAALAYEVVGAVAFPLDQTGQPISAGSGSRLFARLAASLLIASVALLAAESVPREGRGGDSAAA